MGDKEEAVTNGILLNVCVVLISFFYCNSAEDTFWKSGINSS